jgi:hypothetical protein
MTDRKIQDIDEAASARSPNNCASATDTLQNSRSEVQDSHHSAYRLAPAPEIIA